MVLEMVPCPVVCENTSHASEAGFEGKAGELGLGVEAEPGTWQKGQFGTETGLWLEVRSVVDSQARVRHE